MIKLALLLIYNVLLVSFLRFRHGKRICIGWTQRISPSCVLKLYGNGKLYVGRNCQFEAGCDLQVHGSGRLSIGKQVYMNRYCMVSAQGSVDIGDNCIFGPGVKVFDNNHRFDNKHGADSLLSVGFVRIGKNCWIGSNAIILKGADIGDNCVIGAGCIIRGSIPSGSLVRPNSVNIIESIRS